MRKSAWRRRREAADSLEDLEERVAIFLKDAAHQLCDGFGVNFGGFS